MPWDLEEEYARSQLVIYLPYQQLEALIKCRVKVKLIGFRSKEA